MEWMNEKIDRLERGNWIYKIVCFFLFKKKLSYKEMYILLVGINKGKMEEKEVKRYAMNRLLNLYKWSHNNKLPNEIKHDDK